MSGGSWEHMMSVMEDNLDSDIPTSGRNNLYNSGFSGNFTCNTCDPTDNDSNITSLTGIVYPKEKYYDIYDYGTTYLNAIAYSRGQLGDAIYELQSFTNKVSTGNDQRYYMSNWNNDNAHFIGPNAPWLMRGGFYWNGALSGVFAFYFSYGSDYNYISFRSVLAKN